MDVTGAIRVAVDCTRVKASEFERNLMVFPECSPSRGDMFAQQCLDFFEEFCVDQRFAWAIYRDTNSSRDVHEAVAILEDVLRTTRRVFGLQHPFFATYRQDLESARMRLADDESREAFTASAPSTRRRRHRRRPKNSS